MSLVKLLLSLTVTRSNATLAAGCLHGWDPVDLFQASTPVLGHSQLRSPFPWPGYEVTCVWPAMCVHLTHCVSVPLQHELPPRKSRAVAVQAHGVCRRRSEPSRRAPRCSSSRRSGCESLPLRAELQDQRQNEEAGLWHHQKPTPKQGESSNSAFDWSEERHTHSRFREHRLCYLMEVLRLFWIPLYPNCSRMCCLAATVHEIWSKLSVLCRRSSFQL